MLGRHPKRKKKEYLKKKKKKEYLWLYAWMAE